MSVLTQSFTFTGDSESKVCNVPLSTDYMFYAVGDFAGGTAYLEASPDGGANWFTVEELNANGRLIRYLVNGEKVRISVIGSTNPNITSGIRQ